MMIKKKDEVISLTLMVLASISVVVIAGLLTVRGNALALIFSIGTAIIFIFLLLSLKYPFVGLCGWVAFLPVQIDTLQNLGFRIAISDVFLPFMVLPLVVVGKMRLPYKITPYIAALISCFVIATSVAAFRMGFLTRYALINKDLGLLIMLLSLFLIVNLVRSREQMYELMRWLVFSAFVVNTVSLVGYMAELLWGIPTPFLEFEVRLTGLLIDPNAYGGYLVIIFLIQTSLLLARRNLFPPWFMSLNALLLLLGIILTSSRSAWIGLALGAMVLAWFYRARFVMQFLWSLVSIMILSYLLFGLEFINTMIEIAQRKTQIATRWELIQLGLKNFINSPLFGIGLGVFPLLSGGMIIHNTYVWILVEMGIVGFIVLMAFLYRGAKNYWISIKTLPEDRALAIGLFAGYCAMLGVAVGIEAFYQRHFWLLLALSEVLYKTASRRQTKV